LWELKRRILRRSQGEAILLAKYARIHGQPLDVNDPQTFTAKLFCRMIDLNRGNDRGFTRLTDKFAVRPYVADKVGEQHLVPLLWFGSDASDIPFETLPDNYVIKTNHGSGQTIVVEGTNCRYIAGIGNRSAPFDKGEIIDTMATLLKTNYYWSFREYQYLHIKPRIVIEESLRKADGSRLLDYKYFCFDGIPEIIQVDDNYTWDMNPIYDTGWNQIDLFYRDDQTRPEMPKPVNLEEMNRLASHLAEGFDFVRVDLYNVDGHIYFGELTFTPTAGEFVLRPEEWDLRLGQKWILTRK
jgi:hypothetical protein